MVGDRLVCLGVAVGRHDAWEALFHTQLVELWLDMFRVYVRE
jgi:hypothetical protein